MNVHDPGDHRIEFVHDEGLWVSWNKWINVHVKVRWCSLVIDLLVEGERYFFIKVHLQTVVVELVFRASCFSFGDDIVCVRKIAKGRFGIHLQTWVQRIGECGEFRGYIIFKEIFRNPFTHPPCAGVDECYIFR